MKFDKYGNNAGYNLTGLNALDGLITASTNLRMSYITDSAVYKGLDYDAKYAISSGSKFLTGLTRGALYEGYDALTGSNSTAGMGLKNLAYSLDDTLNFAGSYYGSKLGEAARKRAEDNAKKAGITLGAAIRPKEENYQEFLLLGASAGDSDKKFSLYDVFSTATFANTGEYIKQDINNNAQYMMDNINAAFGTDYTPEKLQELAMKGNLSAEQKSYIEALATEGMNDAQKNAFNTAYGVANGMLNGTIVRGNGAYYDSTGQAVAGMWGDGYAKDRLVATGFKPDYWAAAGYGMANSSAVVSAVIDEKTAQYKWDWNENKLYRNGEAVDYKGNEYYSAVKEQIIGNSEAIDAGALGPADYVIGAYALRGLKIGSFIASQTAANLTTQAVVNGLINSGLNTISTYAASGGEASKFELLNSAVWGFGVGLFSSPYTRLALEGKMLWTSAVTYSALIGAGGNAGAQITNIMFSDNKTFSKDFRYESLALSGIFNALGTGTSIGVGNALGLNNSAIANSYTNWGRWCQTSGIKNTTISPAIFAWKTSYEYYNRNKLGM